MTMNPHRFLVLLSVAAAASLASAPAPASASPTCTREVRALQVRLLALGYPSGSLDGCAGSGTRSAVQAFQKVNGLRPDSVAGPATRRAMRAPRAVRPALTRRGRHFEVDLARQVMLRVFDGRVTAVYAVSTGQRGFETPRGTYSVQRKETRSWSVPYRVWLPWASYFTSDGIAIHAGELPPGPASHGCVRVAAAVAAGIYSTMPRGTTIVVR